MLGVPMEDLARGFNPEGVRWRYDTGEAMPNFTLKEF